jgi:hypothetical protein
MESEDWSHGGTTGQVYCDDSLHTHDQPCTQKGNSVTGGNPVYGQTVGITWVKQGTNYGGSISGPGGTFNAWAPGNPQIGNLSGNKVSDDSTRVRVDSAGHDVDFHGLPQVYVGSAGSGGGGDAYYYYDDYPPPPYYY